MIDVETRLSELGDVLALDDDDLASEVMAAIATPPSAARGLWEPSIVWRVAALAAIAVIGAVAAIPSARDAVAGWLGFDRVRIERAPDDAPPDTAAVTLNPAASPSVPSAIDETAIVVGGQTVLLGTIDGRISDAFITKIATSDGSVVPVDVEGNRGLWIAEPHQLLIERDGQPVEERVAGSTLLWQDADVLWRVEGFAELDDALEFARSR